ncbi:hypothetical protein N7G274_010869 [Stereocaulon virgatum]|uniref:Azaphilone pigments biosynthesis cluster protein L N-terminal domain-containing protein n=1 Tax=Stereocaulon virgatum TaxID=373712 RepID=A0ABR3ZTM6_9LECA
MQYKGKTIDGYKGHLASYKATIGLALNLFTLANTALTAEAVDEMKREIYNTSNQTEPDLEVHIEEVTEGLDSLAIKASSISHDQHTQYDGNSSLQVLERQKSVFEEDRLALEAEKKAIEQSQQACANNSGFQLGQNTGVISNLQWGAQS